MIRTILEYHQIAETVLAGSFLLLLIVGAYLWRSNRDRKANAGPDIELEIVDALSIYLGGNRDSSQLRTMAAKHPEEVQDTILRYQSIVAGRRAELCDLAIELGYVQRWCQDTHAKDLKSRRKAFSRIAAVAYYEPVRRLVGNIPATAHRDADEQIRLEAARILLSTGEPEEVVRVFEAALLDTPVVRFGISAELARHAIELCERAVPRALRVQNPRVALSLLVSWERALPLQDVRALAEHADPAVRLEVMRLMPFLPATVENRLAVLWGQSDKDHVVRTAANKAADRLRISNHAAVGQALGPARIGQRALPTGGYLLED